MVWLLCSENHSKDGGCALPIVRLNRITDLWDAVFACPRPNDGERSVFTRMGSKDLSKSRMGGNGTPFAERDGRRHSIIA